MKIALRRKGGGILLSAATVLLATSASAEEGAGELAKQAQNPVAHMISVPFQNNFNFGVGPKQDLQYVLNVQPVIPFRLNEDWNLITRTIVPVIYQPELAPGVGKEAGLGDIQASFFFSPAKPSSVIWGVGPVVMMPSATKEIFGNGKWNLGLSGVALAMKGPWVYGALISDVASVAGPSRREDVHQLVFQPFANYNMPGGWYLTTSPFMTANWKAKSGQKWTVPLGGGIGRVFHVGGQALNAQLQAFGNVEHPDGAASWSLRFQLQFLFPH